MIAIRCLVACYNIQTAIELYEDLDLAAERIVEFVDGAIRDMQVVTS